MAKPLITISGLPASGTTTLSGYLSDTYGFEVVNGGDIFRNIAEDRGLTLSELTELAEEDDSIDKEVDKRVKETIDSHLQDENDYSLIVESRLAGWHAEGRADCSFWVKAPDEVRAERIGNRVETAEELRNREQSEAKRYMEYYNIDITDLTVYDLVIDTGTFSEGEMFNVASSAVDSVLNSN